MRTRRRGFSRRQRPPMQWVTNAWNGNTSVAIAANTLTQFVLLAAPISGVAGVPNIARMTVLNVRGSFQVFGDDAAATAQWSMGIIVKDLVSGDAANVLDPSRALDSDANWMFLRHGSLSGTTAPFDRANDGAWPSQADINLKVKRKVIPGQQLYLAFIASSATRVISNLRVLISRVA